MRTVFWGHNFTNGNDYRLSKAHRGFYYGQDHHDHILFQQDGRNEFSDDFQLKFRA